MNIGETTELGRFTVRCTLRFDNPFWPRYVIFLGDRFIGAQFSMPSADDCQDCERRRREHFSVVRAARRLGRSDGYAWRGRAASLRRRSA